MKQDQQTLDSIAEGIKYHDKQYAYFQLMSIRHSQLSHNLERLQAFISDPKAHGSVVYGPDGAVKGLQPSGVVEVGDEPERPQESFLAEMDVPEVRS